MEEKILKELVAIKKLIMLHLIAQGYSRSAIAGVLGITTADQVRKSIPDIKPGKKDRK